MTSGVASRRVLGTAIALALVAGAASPRLAFGQWAANGSNIYTTGNKVGIGTVNPFFGKFEVRSAGSSDAVISIYGINAGVSGQTRGFYGEVISPDGIGAVGINNATTGVAKALYGESHGDQGIGGYFIANSATGSPRGVYGEAINASNGIGVFGIGANVGVQGQSLVPGVGWAGVFYGNTYLGGDVNLTGGSNGARIDMYHPSDATGNWSVQNGAFTTGNFGIVRYPTGGGADSTKSFVLDSSGRLGIGTATPAEKLHVAGNMYLGALGPTDDQHMVLRSANGVWWLGSNNSGNGSNGNAFYIWDDTNGGGSGSYFFTLQRNTGSVGFGTPTPAARFHVKNNGNFDARLEGADESIVTLRVLETVGGGGDYGGLIRYDGVNNQFRFGTVNSTTETIAMNIARGSTAVAVVGTLSKGGGTFKIDHPLDPENKYLYHSFVESPDMMNIYNGNVVTDARGYATITLPAYFEALNKDFRYQLTVIDGADENSWSLVKVATEIANNEFTLRSSTPNTKVSWQVTGVRKDAFANANRVVPEVEKEPENKGLYQHPDVFGMPTEKGIFGPHPVNPAFSKDRAIAGSRD
jgi:hypothetical protein